MCPSDPRDKKVDLKNSSVTEIPLRTLKRFLPSRFK